MATEAETSAAAKTGGGFRLTKGWVVTIVGCGLAIYVVVGAKNPVSNVKVGPAEMTFGPLGAPGANELKSVAEDVKKGAPSPKVTPPPPAGDDDLKELEKLAEEQPGPSAGAQLKDVLGTWRDQTGGQVQITSIGGNLLTYSETSNLYGIPLQSAVGQGTWTDSRFEFTFNTLTGLSGIAVLQPGAHDTLVGKASFPATGASIPLSLSR